MSVTPQDFDREAGEALRAYRVAPPSHAWAQLEARLPARRPRRPLVAWLWPFGVALGVLASTLLTGLTAEDESLPDALAPTPPLAALPVDLPTGRDLQPRGHVATVDRQVPAANPRPGPSGNDRPNARPDAGSTNTRTTISAEATPTSEASATIDSDRTASAQQSTAGDPLAATARPIAAAGDPREPGSPPWDPHDLERSADKVPIASGQGPVASIRELEGIDLLEARPPEPLELKSDVDARVPQLVLASPASGWALFGALGSRAYVSGDAASLRVEETPFGIGSFDEQDGEETAGAADLVELDVFADPVAVASAALQLEHRGGLAAGIRLSGGARRLDIRASRERLFVLATAVTLGYRHRLGRWSLYGYGLAEHIRQERVTGYVTREYADLLVAATGAEAFDRFVPNQVPTRRLEPNAFEFTDGPAGRWHGATGLGFGLGLDYALNPRWQIGTNGEYLHGRIALGGALRVRLGK